MSQKRHYTDGQDLAVSHHSGATRIGIASIPHRQKLTPVFIFLKSLNACNGYTPKTTKVIEAAVLSGTDKHREKG
jgi:hypothetical protein